MYPWKDWRSGHGVLGKLTPKYRPQPEDDCPVSADAPELGMCVSDDGALAIPPAIRSQYLACPRRAPEWRKLLQEFDRKWNASADQSASPTRPVTEEANSAGNQAQVVPTAGTLDSSGWEAIFPQDATTKEDLEKIGAPAHSFTVSSTCVAQVHEGPKLYLLSTGETELTLDEPILSFGAGTWLLDAKAAAFLQDHVLGVQFFPSCLISVGLFA